MLKLFSSFFNPSTPMSSVDPEALIVGAIIESFASNYRDWQASGNSKSFPWSKSDRDSEYKGANAPRGKWRLHKGLALVNAKTGVKINICLKKCDRDNDDTGPWVYREEISVEGVDITSHSAQLIVSAWAKIAKQVERAERVAQEALERQQANEAKWNLVERLVGMKRTKTGRLIAVSSYCAVCDSNEPDKGAKHNLSCPNAPVKEPKPRRPKLVKPFDEKETTVIGKTQGKVCDCVGSFLGRCDSSCCM